MPPPYYLRYEPETERLVSWFYTVEAAAEEAGLSGGDAVEEFLGCLSAFGGEWRDAEGHSWAESAHEPQVEAQVVKVAPGTDDVIGVYAALRPAALSARRQMLGDDGEEVHHRRQGPRYVYCGDFQAAQDPREGHPETTSGETPVSSGTLPASTQPLTQSPGSHVSQTPPSSRASPRVEGVSPAAPTREAGPSISPTPVAASPEAASPAAAVGGSRHPPGQIFDARDLPALRRAALRRYEDSSELRRAWLFASLVDACDATGVLADLLEDA